MTNMGKDEFGLTYPSSDVTDTKLLQDAGWTWVGNDQWGNGRRWPGQLFSIPDALREIAPFPVRCLLFKKQEELSNLYNQATGVIHNLVIERNRTLEDKDYFKKMNEKHQADLKVVVQIVVEIADIFGLDKVTMTALPAAIKQQLGLGLQNPVNGQGTIPLPVILADTINRLTLDHIELQKRFSALEQLVMDSAKAHERKPEPEVSIPESSDPSTTNG